MINLQEGALRTLEESQLFGFMHGIILIPINIFIDREVNKDR